MFRPLERRERVVVAAGAVVTALALVVTFVLIPEARRWSDREARISLAGGQLARLRSVLAQEESVRAALSKVERERVAADRRLLAGATAAVAGSNLQLLLNRYAVESGMELQRVDAVGRTTDLGSLKLVPARITVRGDIRGLVDLLLRLQRGETLLAIDELQVSTSTGLREEPDLLTASIGLHGYHRGSGSDR